MKKMIFAFIFAMSGLAMQAQEVSTDEIAYIKDILKKEKKDLVKEYMGLSETDATKFWPLYEEFQNQRAGLNRERLQLIKDYGAQYDMLTGDQAKSLAKRALKNDKANLKLKSKYFNKISKKVGGLKAAQYMQLEDYFQTLVRYEIQDAIPFIGEIERTRGK
jgi:hypothetical protein